MRGNLDRVMPHVFQEEGGYVDHPHDPGGATNLGITIKTLSDWRGKPVSKAAVKGLGKDEATRIYEARYAKPIRFDDLPSGVDYAVLDFAINSGPSRAVKYLQKVLGVAQDGVVGTLTLRAVNARDADNVVSALCNARMAFLKSLGTWGTFGKGWTARVERVRRRSLALTGAPAGPAPLPSPPTKPKPVPVPPKKDLGDSNTWAAILAIIGVSVAALAGTVMEFFK